MTATADRIGPGWSRGELRLVELASGLLMLLDAHRLIGRLPLEVQVQASRLRHAVKLAVQAEAARTVTFPPPPPLAASQDQGAALRAWIAAQPWVQPGPQGWVYLLCFRDPTSGQHAPPGRQRLSGAVRRPLLGLDRRPHPPHQPRASQPPLARPGPPRPGRPGRRADLRARLV
jgi:hypothetical protein